MPKFKVYFEDKNIVGNLTIKAKNPEEAKQITNNLFKDIKITKIKQLWSNRAHPMIFKNEKALRFLLQNGEVYTLRTHKKRNGRVWITNRAKGRKIADGVIKLVSEFNLNTESDFEKFVSFLEYYVDKSGFSSVSEWVAEALALNRGRMKKFYLYRVKLINGGSYEQ